MRLAVMGPLGFIVEIVCTQSFMIRHTTWNTVARQSSFISRLQKGLQRQSCHFETHASSTGCPSNCTVRPGIDTETTPTVTNSGYNRYLKVLAINVDI